MRSFGKASSQMTTAHRLVAAAVIFVLLTGTFEIEALANDS